MVGAQGVLSSFGMQVQHQLAIVVEYFCFCSLATLS